MFPRLQVVKANRYFLTRLVLICMIILLLLGGCVTTQPYGSFIQNPSPAFSQYSKVMADDVANQIGRLYPAATTQLDLRHNANDPFGQVLIDKLRSDGFAVLENTSPANSFLAAIQSPEDSENTSNTPINVEDIKNHGLAFGYIIDQSGDLYHVSILIEDQQLTRAFIAQSGLIQPAGLWVRKE